MRNSKMARRLVKIFVLMVSIPLLATVAIIGMLGRDQVTWVARQSQEINANAVQEAGDDLQKIGQGVIASSNAKASETAEKAISSMARTTNQMQDEALRTTARDLNKLTSESFDSAVQRSLSTHRRTLDEVRLEMGQLFARTSQQTKSHATRRIEQSMRSLIHKGIEERSQHLVEEANVSVDRAVDYLKIAAQVPDLLEGNSAGQKALLDSLVRRIPTLIEVAVLDRNGKETAKSSADRAITKTDLGAFPTSSYFRAGMQGQEYINQDEFESVNGAPVLRLAVPIELYKGRPVGVLAARFSLFELWSVIRNSTIGKSGYAFVLDGSGKTLLAPRLKVRNAMEAETEIERLKWKVVVALPELEVIQPITELKDAVSKNTEQALQEMSQHIQRSSNVTAQKLQMDASRLRRSATIQVQSHSSSLLQKMESGTANQTHTELLRLRQRLKEQTALTKAVSSRKMHEAADASIAKLTDKVQPLILEARARADQRLIGIALLLTIISCILSCILALFTAGRIVRPVVRLAQVTHAIAEGDLDKRVEESAPDEIGDLAVAFNRMAASLKQSRTELDDAEAQLVQSAKLASLGTLSAGVAHELNQPVAIIRGLSQQLQDEPGLSGDVLADLELIEGQTSRMIKIIKHLRTFSRAGKNEFNPVDVNQVARDCFILIGEQLRSHNITIEYDLAEEPLMVYADANELEQVFINLITNARDAIDGQSDAVITLRTRIVEDQIVLEVQDNGPGVPADVAERIFDPFFTTKEVGKGTGLGLSISHTIISKHNGTMRTENRNGAVFIVTLPQMQAMEEYEDMAA